MAKLKRGKGADHHVYSNARGNHGPQRQAARIASDMPEFKAAAVKVLAEVKAAVAAHSDSGKMAASVSLEKGAIDYHIVSGIDYNWHAEFGHFVYFDEDGNFTSRENAASKKWVDGIGAFRSVVAAHGGF